MLQRKRGVSKWESGERKNNFGSSEQLHKGSWQIKIMWETRAIVRKEVTVRLSKMSRSRKSGAELSETHVSIPTKWYSDSVVSPTRGRHVVEECKLELSNPSANQTEEHPKKIAALGTLGKLLKQPYRKKFSRPNSLLSFRASSLCIFIFLQRIGLIGFWISNNMHKQARKEKERKKERKKERDFTGSNLIFYWHSRDQQEWIDIS